MTTSITRQVQSTFLQVPPKIKREAVKELQWAAEELYTDLFKDASAAPMYAERKTVMPKDLFIVIKHLSYKYKSLKSWELCGSNST